MPLSQRATNGISKLLLGNIAGQLITLALTPILFRYYSPSEFGQYSVLFALAVLLATVATWKLDLAIQLAKTTAEAFTITRTVLTVAVPTTLLFAVPALLWISNDLPRDLVTYILLALTALAVVGYSAYSQLALRGRLYQAIAIRNITQPSFSSAFQFALAFVWSSAGLALGAVAGRLLTTLTLRRSMASFQPESRHPLTLASMTAVVRRYWRFPLVFVPSGLLNTLGTQLPVLLGSAYLGAATIGLFVMGQRFTTAPVSLITSAFGQVISAELANRIRQGNSSNRRMYLTFSLVLGALSLVGVLVTLYVIPPVLHHILPPEWHGIDSYVPALAIIVGSTFIASPLSVVFLVYEAAWPSLALDSSRVALIWCAAQWALVSGFDGPGLLTAMAVAQCANYAMSWVAGLAVVWRRQKPPVASQLLEAHHE